MKLAALATVMLTLAARASAMMIDGKQMAIDEAIIKAGSKGMMSEMYNIMQDNETVMVELDMLYPMGKYTEMRKEMSMADEEDKNIGARKKRKAIIPASYYRWTNKVVPYEISYEFSSRDRNIIMQAINDYHKFTCIRFKQASSADKNKIRFQNGGGCSSYVGMIGGRQGVSLAPGCRYKGVVIHEMGHAIGFQHEQTRDDRNSYVVIEEGNIQSGLAYNFMRYSSNQVSSYNVPYDYLSVMHYSQYAFSRNGRPTILAREGKFQNQMGNREGLSFSDIHLANKIYSCDDGCQKRRCPSGGFQAKDCKCYCDSGDRTNPMVECGSGVRVTKPAPVETTTTPAPTTKSLMCEDILGSCSSWASRGYCRGRYEAYMQKNCRYSCNYCQMTTTAPTTTAAPEGSCRDENQYCELWAKFGECSRNPSYMERHCKKSCGTCSGGGGTCLDMNKNCPYWTSYCSNPVYEDYLSMNCAKSCNKCRAGDVTAAPATTDNSSNQGGPLCRDRGTKQYCDRKRSQGKCLRSTVQHKCEKTCGKC